MGESSCARLQPATTDGRRRTIPLPQELKSRIQNAQLRAAFAVSRELVLLYWSIGRDILARQGSEGWGAKVIARLSHHLQVEFPGVEGFSQRSLKYMRSFAEAWPENQIVQQVAALLPWGHHMVLLDRFKDAVLRGVVSPGGGGVWVEPQCHGAPDQERTAREGREGVD